MSEETTNSPKPEQEMDKKPVNKGPRPQAKEQNSAPKDESKDGAKEVRKPRPNNNNKKRMNHKREVASPEVKAMVKANNQVHINRLNPHYKLDLNTKAKVRITPVGGLGEIGGNCMVVETEKSAIIIDAGMSFPSEDMYGVNILIPDYSYLHAIKDKIAGLIITHAHEDHIGGVPYMFKELQVPVYGTSLPLAMLSSKFDEFGLKEYKSMFHPIEKRSIVKVGDFELEWIHMTHSIIDSSALAIRTEAGIIFHTADFKIDHTPIDNFPSDLHRIAHYGEEGVMLLMSDSTNSHRPGVTKSELELGSAFERAFRENKNSRIIMSTFSSNIHRVYHAIKYALEAKRKLCIIGRSMEKNLEITRNLGYIYIPNDAFISPHDLDKYPDNELFIVTTGSQGETMSALWRIASEEHRHVKLKPNDLVMISAKAIPGNESSVSSMLNLIMKAGAKVIYQDFAEIHVSGHAAQEEQKLMLRLVKPKFFLPVHGEYNHIERHKRTAQTCGIPEKNICLMDCGDTMEITPMYLKKVGSVKVGKKYIDRNANNELEHQLVEDKKRLAEDGIMAVSAVFKNNKLLSYKFSCYGVVAYKNLSEFSQGMTIQVKEFFKNYNKDLGNAGAVETALRQVIRKSAYKVTKKYPTIVCNVFVYHDK